MPYKDPDKQRAANRAIVARRRARSHLLSHSSHSTVTPEPVPLFADLAPPAKVAPIRIVDPHSPQGLINYFDQQHVAKFGIPAAIITGKDHKHFHALKSRFGDDGRAVLDLIDALFASDDPFITSSGYTVGLFVSQATKLHIARRDAAVGLDRLSPRGRQTVTHLQSWAERKKQSMAR